MKRAPPFKPGKDQPNLREQQLASGRKPWWTCQERNSEETKAGSDMVSTVRAILDEQQGYQAACERHLRLYKNRALEGMLPQVLYVPTMQRLSTSWGIPASLNVVRPMINTMTSRVSMDRLRATFSTEGARRETRETARKLEMYVDGELEEVEGHDRLAEQIQQAGIFGMGYTRPYICDGEPKVDPVFSPEVVVDEMEGMYRMPRNLYRVMMLDRDLVADLWPKQKEKIAAMPAVPEDIARVWWLPSSAKEHQMLMVVTGYHLPSGHKKGDGRICVATGGVTLEYDEYADDEHEYLDLRWSIVPGSYRGLGLAEELIGTQLEINRLVRQIQNAIRLLSNPYLLIEGSSGVVPAQIKGLPGIQIKYNGNRPPQVYVPQTVHTEVFNFLNLLYGKAYELARLNPLMMSGTAPKRFSSGRAQEANIDITDSGYAWFYQQYQKAGMRLMKRLIKLGKRTNYKVRVLDRERMSEMNWKDVNLKDDRFIMRAWSTQFLGNSPQAKRDSIDWMANRGLITKKEQIYDLIDSPDIQKFTRRTLGGERYLEEMFQSMLDGGPYQSPPSEIDLKKAMALCQDMILEAYYDKVDREDIAKLQKWVGHARRMEQDREQRAADLQKMNQAAQPGMLPGAAPGPAALPPSGGLPEAALMPEGAPAVSPEGLPAGGAPVDPSQIVAAMGGGNGAM